MASIRQRGTKWQARVLRQGFPAETATFTTRAEAEAWAFSVEAEFRQGSYKDRSSLDTLVSAILLQYEQEVCLSPTTPRKSGHDDAIRIRAVARSKLGQYSLANLTPIVLAEWRDTRLKTVSAGTVVRDLACLSAIFNHARREWGYPFDNPVQGIRKPTTPQGRTRTLTLKEEEALLAAAAPVGRRSPWLQPIITLALETGMRKGELLSLQWENINLSKRTATLPATKNGTCRVVPLSSKAVACLEAITGKSVNGSVFHISRCALHLRWKAACVRAGVEGLHFHDLRHTAITRMSDKLSNVIELSAVTGHKSVQMLKRYYHPSAEALALKLG